MTCNSSIFRTWTAERDFALLGFDKNKSCLPAETRLAVKMKAMLRGVCVTTVLFGGILQVHSADLVVAMPDWPSVQASANIIKVALEKSLKIDVKKMGTLIAFTGLDSSKVDLYPEVWQPNLESLVQKEICYRGTVNFSLRSVSETQGLCITKKIYDDYGIHDVADLKDTVC